MNKRVFMPVFKRVYQGSKLVKWKSYYKIFEVLNKLKLGSISESALLMK
jgi:hypothetical protein